MNNRDNLGKTLDDMIFRIAVLEQIIEKMMLKVPNFPVTVDDLDAIRKDIAKQQANARKGG